ncbi:hypothetical protein M6B22_04400 [Jatrophihabitans cynanchi]|jgi:hypothetical protein|uniref:Uncharacterized protein n=1 Tax=Jatrophihabitans cynanchi TaxID=2944128 RepID=A0ABY7JZK2_9ACTN|nr:hypothetical protein [Jatrophihabitans sp. SB3-54]WAX58013.1 hypothetical protein M6B22_04400 [Jatrophihabitans sp. SB3-54]
MSEQSSGGLGGDELGRMLHAVQDWATRTFPPAGEHESTCQWCPLCQLMAVLRGERPDVNERVAEAGSAVVSALRNLLDATGAGGHASEPEDKPRVQRIDLGGEPAGDEG